MKIFRSCIMTVFLVVLSFAVGRYFLTGYKSYDEHKERKAELVRQVKWLSQIQSERKEKLHDILRINNFVNHAKLLGLKQEKWAVYNVNIEDTVTFEEMKKILKQCSNADSHYFRPVSFHIKSLKAAGNMGKGSEMTYQNESGDILMTLKGAFVVKNQKLVMH